MKALDWDKARIMSQVPVYLDSFAALWYNKLTKDGAIAPHPTWIFSKDATVERFQSENYKKQMKLQLNKRKLVGDQS